MSLSYQLPTEPLETVWAKDRERMAGIHQPDMVDPHLGELLREPEGDVELEEFLDNYACPPTVEQHLSITLRQSDTPV